jgi:hypothetical protein
MQGQPTASMAKVEPTPVTLLAQLEQTIVTLLHKRCAACLGLLAECGCQLLLSESAGLECTRSLPQKLQYAWVVHPGLQATTCSASISKGVSIRQMHSMNAASCKLQEVVQNLHPPSYG